MAATQIETTPGNIQMKNIGGRVGSYAISTVNFDSWMNEPIVYTPQKTRKTRGTKDIVNKIFSDCAAVTTDPFWIDKFTNAAMGKLPHKFSYHDGSLTFRKGAKCHSLEVSHNPYEASHACMEFFRVNGGIFSPMDEQNSMVLQYSRAHDVSTQQQLTWGDSNKKVQECMLSYYVTDMKNIMKLSNTEVEQLRQTIRLGIGNKYFGKHNIRIENNRMHTITGLLWNNETKIFYIDPDLKPITTRTYVRKKDGCSTVDAGQKDMVPQFGLKWTKYVESLDAKILENNSRQRRVNINHQDPHFRHLQLVTSSGTTTATSYSDPTSTCNDDD
jgi:hypothetical protein